MPTYRLELKNARLQAVIDDIGSNAKVVIGTTGMAMILATVPLDSPAFSAPASGIIALANVPRVDPDAANTGLARAAQVQQEDGTVVIDGLVVGVASGHVQLEDDNVKQHKQVRLLSGTITHP